MILLPLFCATLFGADPATNFEVRLESYVFGSHLDQRILVTSRHLSVEQFPHQTRKVLVNRDLTLEEQRTVARAVREIPLQNVKTEYINRGVRGEGSLVIFIRRGQQKKRITIYFEHPAVLCNLSDTIDRLIPAEARIVLCPSE